MPNHLYKQIDELTIADFEIYPIWEFVREEDPNSKDECTIKGNFENFDTLEDSFFVKAKFILNDETVLSGYVTPKSGLSSSQPVILIEDRRILFWHGTMKPTQNDLLEFYKILNKKAENVFPITWKTEIEVGDVKTGVIEGFGYYNDVMDVFDDIIQLVT